MPSAIKTITVDLLRHGQPEGGEVLRGRVDHPLSELGWAQMQQAAALTGEGETTTETPAWTHLISSPLKRCREFAEHLAAESGQQLHIDEGWQEIDYGDWDGMALSDWRELAGPQFKDFRKDVSKLVPPNGEPFLSFKERVLGQWNAVSELPDGSHALIVTHGGVLRVVLPTVLGMPLNRSYPLHIPFASLSRVVLTVDESKQGGDNDEPRFGASLSFHNAAGF